MTPEEKKLRRTEEAKGIYNHPIFKEALENLRKTCFHNIETSSHDQGEQREDLYYMLRCISAFEREIKKIMDEGKVTAINLQARQLIR